jgi:hypothetical protein
MFSFFVLSFSRNHIGISTTRKDFGNLTVSRESVVDGFAPDQWVVEQVKVPIPNDNVCEVVPFGKNNLYFLPELQRLFMLLGAL